MRIDHGDFGSIRSKITVIEGDGAQSSKIDGF
jgi:hypothetical protein